MSRILLEPKDKAHEVVVGLDRPMSTFFITVTIKQDDEDLEDLDPILFKGRWAREDVVANIEKYAADNPKRKKVIDLIWMDLDPAKVLEN